MNRLIIVLAGFILTFGLEAQNQVQPTSSLIIDGKVRKGITYSLSELESLPPVDIKEVVLYNHKGEVKDTLRGMKGIPLKTLLEPVTFDYQQPKELNEFYLLFTASDGYKVVFSWNEVFNTETGNQLFVVTEMKGQKLGSINQRILFISASDEKTGRRYIKGLERINVRRAE